MNVKNATEIGGNYVGVEVKSIQDVVWNTNQKIAKV